MIDINLQKKNQRVLSAQNRLQLHYKINKKNLLFYKILNSYHWFEESAVIASFVSIKSEISTISLNKFILNSGKVLCLPVVSDDNDGKLIFKQFKKGDHLVAGKFGVLEPINTSNLKPDILFIPCLAYDKYGYRLGYGGGFYDKTISHFHSIKHTFLKVGLAYDDQRVDKVIHNHLDQKLNYILTEKHLYEI